MNKTNQMNQINLSRQSCSSRLSCRNPSRLLLLHPSSPYRPHHDDHLRPERESLIDALLSISREDDDSVVTLDALEKMGRLGIRALVMGIVGITAGPEQRVCFIEEEDCATGFCFIKYGVQILLSFTDVLAHHRRQIHPEQIDH
jgi:hypothetical protein